MISDHKSGDFLVVNEEGVKLTKTTIRNHDMKVSVFNQDFIRENIDWDKTVKSILLISEENIVDKKKLESLKAENINVLDKKKKIEEQLKKYQIKQDKFLSTRAKDIKNSLDLISSGDSKYMFYNKTKFEKVIKDNEDYVKEKGNILSKDEIKRLTDSSKPVSKTEISFNKDAIVFTKLKEAKTKIESFLAREVISKVIDRLKDNSDIQSWVQDGLRVYEKYNSRKCEFCGNDIKANRITDLQEHFNDEYNKLINDLDKAYEWLDTLKPNPDFFNENLLYDEFRAEYLECINNYASIKHNILSNIETLKVLIVEKKSNPFKPLDANLDFVEFLYDDYIALSNRITEIVAKHNSKTINFSKRIEENKTKIELHYATYYVNQDKYFDVKSAISKARGDLQEEKDKSQKLLYDIDEIEKKLSNETLGADKFNVELAKFLNRDEITLEFDKDQNGYTITRKNSGKQAESLSEGEKTAIAFVYFLVKLAEKDNKLEDTIVVIDDPISSFDSNHLFHALTFMTKKCSDVKQLFVLTHNFWFFKLVRDWMKKKNTKSKTESSFYVIKNKNGVNGREAYIENCDNSLIRYHSEYHYLFTTLLKYKDQESLSFEDAYSVGNVSRRLLESFLSFKYPQHTGNFRNALEFSKHDSEKVDRIYYYVQKFSHSDRMEAHEGIPDNLIGEGLNIINDVLDMIKKLDEVHYDQIVKVCKN